MLSNDMLFKTSGFAVLWRQKFHNEILAILKIYKATSRTREVKLDARSGVNYRILDRIRKSGAALRAVLPCRMVALAALDPASMYPAAALDLTPTLDIEGIA